MSSLLLSDVYASNHYGLFVPICFLFYHLNVILFSKISYHITYAFSKKPRLIKNNLKTTVLTIQPNFLLNGIRLLLKRPIFNLAS